ncbi:MAG: hypothetical protein WCK02_02130 [Bacteroidota bacterium]
MTLDQFLSLDNSTRRKHLAKLLIIMANIGEEDSTFHIYLEEYNLLQLHLTD